MAVRLLWIALATRDMSSIVPDSKAVALAEERFRDLTGKGFRAVALSGDGSPGKLSRKFDKEVEQTLFIPQLQGG
jgi:hypothetical protein